MACLAERIQHIKTLAEIRRELHKIPELSHEETRTASVIARLLNSYGPVEVIESIGGTGIIATFEGSEPVTTLLFRAELDAVPITEKLDIAHKSAHDGIAHKCGHDGHMAMVIGLARLLGEHTPAELRVHVLFQPAEETGEGAQKMLDDPAFEAIKPDYVFALHNLPGFPLGHVIIKDGPFTASVISLIARFIGKTSHAAEPEKGINPAGPMSEVLSEVLKLSNNDQYQDEFAVITPVYMTLGEKAYGISAGYGELHLTIRTWTVSQMDSLKEKVVSMIHETGSKYHLQTEIEWLQEFATNRNNPEAANKVRSAAKALDLDLIERDLPFKWGEDFGLFTKTFKGALFGLGAGQDQPALHSPEYDFPDELLETGARLFYQIATEFSES